ncbi:aldehyde dehydrogenase family protein [bacterium]|nr:aldehyde dehydrogenase family protein [bacterium]
MSHPPFAAEVAACRTAQRDWAVVPVRERLRCVRALRALLVARADELVAAAHADIGRTRVEVVATELLPTASALKFLETDAARVLAPRRVRRTPLWLIGCRDAVHRRPWGVVGVIGTWNYPIYLNVVQLAQALAAGNGVLWKPSEVAPHTAAVATQLFADAGFPPGLLVTLPATREAGPQLAESDIDHVVFTGSDAVGRKLAARLGDRLVPSTLELSGCDAMFVLADADAAFAARAAWFGLTLNRGQTCIAVRRVFVHRSRLAEVLTVLEPLVTAAGPVTLATPGQAKQHDQLIADAAARGATVVGGEPGVRPTLLVNAPPDALVCREAAFSPVCAVIPFDTIDDAVSQSALSPFGLAASVFTADPRTAEALAARIRAGSVVVNDVIAPTAHPATPFGGLGASGWGVTQGAEGLLAMTVPQAVTVRRGRFRPHVDEAISPDPEATAEILTGLLRASYGGGWRAWWSGVRQMMRGGRWKKR